MKCVIYFYHITVFLLQVAKCNIKVEMVDDSFTELRGEIAGPPDTPYESGKFILDIKIPDTYPFNPPKVKILWFTLYLKNSIITNIYEK